jgi:V8-like Glu-specific endopeptidase
MGCSSSSSVNTVEEKNKKQNIDIEDDSIVPKYILVDKLCETIMRIENENKISTGFFIKININKKKHNYIITSAYSITKEDIDSKITISFFYSDKKETETEKETEKQIELDNNKRFIKCFIDDDIDATIIEILPEDDIPEDKYLYPDLNYKSGFDNYMHENKIFTAGYPDIGPYKDEKHYSGGEIIGIRYINKHNYHFYHKCSTKEGSSGSPLVNDKFQVVGIHYGCNKKMTENFGFFVGAIIDILNGECEENKSNFKEKIQKDVKIEIKKLFLIK